MRLLSRDSLNLERMSVTRYWLTPESRLCSNAGTVLGWLTFLIFLGSRIGTERLSWHMSNPNSPISIELY